MRALVKVVSTGGTIACKHDPVLGTVPALTGDDLVSAAPGLGDIADVQVDNFSNIPSDYIDFRIWLNLSHHIGRLLADPKVTGVVVTHGTDTLEETAYFLDLALSHEKPVVLVGAQRPSSVWDADGPRNLLDAVRVAVSPQAMGLGVLTAMSGKIHAAAEVTKVHTSKLDALHSRGHGSLGLVDEDGVFVHRRPSRRHVLPPGERVPRVDIIPVFAGADGVLIRAALAAGTEGLVIQALGRGNVNREVYEAITHAIARGVPVIISTRVPQGRTLPVYDFVGGGKTLESAGAIFSGDLTPQKARVLLLVALSRSCSAAEIKELFQTFEGEGRRSTSNKR